MIRLTLQDGRQQEGFISTNTDHFEFSEFGVLTKGNERIWQADGASSNEQNRANSQLKRLIILCASDSLPPVVADRTESMPETASHQDGSLYQNLIQLRHDYHKRFAQYQETSPIEDPNMHAVNILEPTCSIILKPKHILRINDRIYPLGSITRTESMPNELYLQFFPRTGLDMRKENTPVPVTITNSIGLPAPPATNVEILRKKAYTVIFPNSLRKKLQNKNVVSPIQPE